MVEFPDVPVVTLDERDAEDGLNYLIANPEGFVKETLEGTSFQGYVPETLVIDSATMGCQSVLGKPHKYDKNNKKIVDGYGIMSTDRIRVGDLPSIEDYRELYNFTLSLFNGTRALNDRYHTIVTAHAFVGEYEDDSRRDLKSKSKNPGLSLGLPVLPGKLKWHADNICDFYIYCESKSRGNRLMFYAHTMAQGMWHARTKIYGRIDASIEDPTFDKIYNAYLKALNKEDNK